jgi:hypothetical protein
MFIYKFFVDDVMVSFFFFIRGVASTAVFVSYRCVWYICLYIEQRQRMHKVRSNMDTVRERECADAETAVPQT